VRQLADQFGLSDGYRVVINNGPAAGQTVDHLHLHLIGGRSLDWPPG
jgi:histidine triad (HIT) family protein